MAQSRILDSGRNEGRDGLQGKTYGQVLDYFVAQAAQRGLWVMPDMHVNTVSGGLEPLWYNSSVTDAQWIQAWVNIVTR
jgi:aryl-phospho-beta-D-glucosidase BglC (GH1 family)